MKTIEVYDPPMCCASGVCGPTPDAALASFASALEQAKSAGASVRRFNLAHEPLAFAQRDAVKVALEAQGEASLPLIFIDGALRFSGAYPAAEQLNSALNDNSCGAASASSPRPSFIKAAAPTIGGSRCCDPSTGCC